MTVENVKKWVTKAGYTAMIRVVSLGVDLSHIGIEPSHYCGYVKVPESHPYFNKDYFDLSNIIISDENPMKKLKEKLAVLDLNIYVHGGLTYSDHIEESSDWWLGFDCGHSGDSIKVYDLDYVTRECENLADQLKYLESELEGVKLVSTHKED